jgi:hypothetical protein
MASEGIGASALLRVLSEVVADVADLFQKELKLARAEVSANLASKLHAGIWMITAALFGFVALLLFAEAVVFFIASYGIALHWASLIVAGVLALLAVTMFLRGRSEARQPVAPTRAVQQIKKDISVAKEQLT